MNNKSVTPNKQEKIVLYFMKLLITAAFSGSLYYGWLVYYNPDLPTPFFRFFSPFLGGKHDTQTGKQQSSPHQSGKKIGGHLP